MEQTEPQNALPEMTYADLPEPMQAACARAGWTDLTPVQRKAIPYVVRGRDVMVQARTGSGKTGAFVLPLLDLLDPSQPHCQALVLVPTRELAQQVADEAKTLVGDEGFRTAAVFGGVSYKGQIDAFRAGAQLVVGTPGRILDHLMNRDLKLDQLRVLIFDEADRMLSVGFYPDMKRIQRYLPKRLFGAFMFSATFPHSVLRLSEEFLESPDLISLSGKQVHIAEIEHLYCKVPSMGKERRLIRLIEMENPTSAIIFCNTKKNVEFLAEVLKSFGYDAEPLSSDLTQARREQVLARIKSGQLRLLVATDVAARGIDIRELSHVFLYEPPEDPESYIHRAGRTGRAGASGTVITLVDLVEEIGLRRIATRFGIQLQERKAPEEDEVVRVVEDRLTALLETRRRAVTALQGERISRFLALGQRLAADEDGQILLALLLDDAYQASLNQSAPEPQGAPQRLQPRPVPRRSEPRASESPAADVEAERTGGKRRRRPRRRKPQGEGGEPS